jgi:hypothetical protein
MLNILTPLAKLTRVSRKIDPATFVAAPGIWAAVASDASIANQVNGVLSKVNKLVISSASSSVYESNDVEVGRIATLESPGARCTVDSAGFAGTPAAGDDLAVAHYTLHLGKLVTMTSLATTYSGTTFTVVARTEQYDSTAGTLTFETVSPHDKVA